MSQQDDPIAQLERLKSEAAEHRVRVGKLASVDAQRELSSELWPWMESFCETLRAILEEQAEVLDELIDGTQNTIDFQLGAKILGVFEVGKQLAAAAEQVLPLVQLAPQKNALAALIANFRAAADHVGEEVAAVMVEESEAGADDTDGAEDEDEDEDEEVRS